MIVRILLVEDDPAVGDATARGLRSQSWAVDWVKSGKTVPDIIKQISYDVVILDVGLPDIDGFETLRRMRAQGSGIPILMLTARDSIEDKVHGLQTGADDYLVKPFSLAELVARVQALTRRTHMRQTNEILLGALRIDLTAMRAFCAGEPLELTPREWAVLTYLLSHAHKVVSKAQILEAVADWDESPSSNAIEVYVSRLRSKISSAGVSIKAIRGFGYLVEEHVDGV
jgi:DNA-binding response OmpR family regulator